jgi:chromosome segregation protein
MHFKKLEIVGFKSFYQKTVFNFEPGITAVVGPNGTGKSNVFDSIRWVLGEQSIKALRGSEMQDVIFNGTDTKEPLSMAEVSLTFANEKRYFAVEHDEVVISRRIFRSGESEYLLNKTPVRLKDILDLLMGTGIGAESYSLVAQGQIDLILSSRPEDRRLIFDEAAGITKYKAQKKEALRKLEETEQNLLRINDIVAEVKRQIASLERQANKARRYKETFEELKTKELVLAALQKKELQAQRDQLILQLSDLETQEFKLLGQIQSQEMQIIDCQTGLKTLEQDIAQAKGQILDLENLIARNKEHINFNQERITELNNSKEYLKNQVKQAENRIALDEQKLAQAKGEYLAINKSREEKSGFLKAKEVSLSEINSSVKTSLENIAQAKRSILELVAKMANLKNEIAEAASKEQFSLARKKRLEIEKAKAHEEKSTVEVSLGAIIKESEVLESNLQELNTEIAGIKKESEAQRAALNNFNTQISDLEKQMLTLASHKEFLERLKTKYADITEAMNAVIYLDKLPAEKISGLVVKINDYSESKNLKLSGEAKPVDLDTAKIQEKINGIQQKIESLKNDKTEKEKRIEELDKAMAGLQEELRNQEIILANKKTSRETILEQFNKIKEEEEIVVLEITDIEKELALLQEKLAGLGSNLSQQDKQEKSLQELIAREQSNISLNNSHKEEALVVIAQIKTELDTLNKQAGSEEATLKALQETRDRDKEELLALENRWQEFEKKQEALNLEIKELQEKIRQGQQDIEIQNNLLKEQQAQYKELSSSISEVVKKIDGDRKGHERLKNRLHELQMQNKDIDFKYLTVKERILQAYKIDLDTLEDSALVTQEIEVNILLAEIEKLKQKLEAYGTVNLVAIEEYDELKKRYDFLAQQQSDLLSAKEQLHEAILKINRTTKKMFLETFEKTRLEFRNYFRLLFNGGDAQIFLLDENDPLESGIEIICRPPGKKLQNILLLSGGEKALSAIALIFAIFKIKPSPFCILDEIDAALDEANVDRYGRLLQEFAKASQFIVITHNKKTIANADIMYGITMEESGVSKIVSVKFSQNREPREQKEPQAQTVPA